MMNRKSFFLTGAILATGCTVLEDNSMPKPVEDSAPKKIDFDITVTRDGKTLSSGPGTKTKAEVNTSDMLATMDPDKIKLGKQYTFHIGLDLSSTYQEITFTASVSDWETKIYEDNEDF